MATKKTKCGEVKKHLLKKKSITSWEAIELYGATRLSAIIFNLRKAGWVLDNRNMRQKDRNGNETNYVKYVLVSNPA